MKNDIRVYNYYDNEPLITRMSQAKAYFDDKFANIHTDVDFSEVDEKLDEINEEVSKINLKVISQQITDSTSEIIDAIEDSKPCLCHLATKEDVCKAKCTIINKIEESKNEVIKEIDEKFVDLNEIIK